MVKMEAFDESHFMHQAVRVGLTDHTGSIVSLMACIVDLKRNFYVTGNSSKLHSVSGLYSLGMVKIEAFDDRCFMHQFVTLTNVRRYVCIYICMYVCVYVCIVWVYICQSHPKVRANQMNIMKSEAQMYFRPNRS